MKPEGAKDQIAALSSCKNWNELEAWHAALPPPPSLSEHTIRIERRLQWRRCGGPWQQIYIGGYLYLDRIVFISGQGHDVPSAIDAALISPLCRGLSP